jgi:hypothetical protein
LTIEGADVPNRFMDDTASGDDRHFQSIDNLRDERHRTGLRRNILAEKNASVSTSFKALGDDRVTFPVFQPSGRKSGSTGSN